MAGARPKQNPAVFYALIANVAKEMLEAGEYNTRLVIDPKAGIPTRQFRQCVVLHYPSEFGNCPQGKTPTNPQD